MPCGCGRRLATAAAKPVHKESGQLTTVNLVLDDNDQAMGLFGHSDVHLRAIERKFPVRLVARGSNLIIEGPPAAVQRVQRLFQELIDVLSRGHRLTEQDVEAAINMAAMDEEAIGSILGDTVIMTKRGRPVRPKTAGQKEYLEAMRRSSMVFAIGPAGTGKTYLAVAMAVAALKKGQVHRIILTRPAVEAGEKLGFLPCALQEKVNPYLRPLYDALYDMLGLETVERYMARGIIEVAPLAYMRGRTLEDSFIILDEAQNTTPEQMKMFLTRMGAGSRVVVTGDITQVDLPKARYSGLHEVRTVLSGVEGITFIYLSETDVVRHPLVQRIIKAYESFEAEQGPADDAAAADDTP